MKNYFYFPIQIIKVINNSQESNRQCKKWNINKYIICFAQQPNRKKKTKTYNLLGGVGSPRKWKKYPASYPNYPGASGRYVGYQRRGWDDDKIARRQKKEEDRLFLRAERGQTIFTRNQQFDELGNWRKDTNGFIYYDIRYNRKKMVKT